MNYVLSASRLMTAGEVIKLGRDLKNNAAIVAAVESKVKQQFSQQYGA